MSEMAEHYEANMDATRHANHSTETQINEKAARKVAASPEERRKLLESIFGKLTPDDADELRTELRIERNQNQRAEAALAKAQARIDLVLELCRNAWRKTWRVTDTDFTESVEKILTSPYIPKTCPQCSGYLPPECGPDCPTCQVDIAQEIHECAELHYQEGAP